MKKLRYKIIIPVLMIITVVSCKKKPIDAFTPDKMFTPTELTIATKDTAVVISWPSSLFSQNSGVNYTLQISQDSTFQAAPAFSLIVDSTSKTISDDSLKDRTPYFARVKANANTNAAASDWVLGAARFSLVGVQIFKPIQSSDIIDNAVILHWTTTPGVTKIILTAPNGDTIQSIISEAANTAGQKTINRLKANTAYSAEIFAGTRSKGLLNFTTKVPVVGDNVVDLRGIEDRPQVLFDTLSQISARAIVLLERGLTYTIPSTYVFDKGVRIMSGLGFGDAATLLLSSNFDASGNIDTLGFSDLTIQNDGGASYFMNVGNVAKIGTLNVTNCVTKGVFNNSFIRLKTSGDLISNLNIKNCIIDSFGVAAKYAVFYANASSNAKIDNINIQNSTFYSFYYFVRQDGVSASSLVINNCTFNDMINNGGYFANYSGSFPSAFNITNSIFGRTIDPTNANGIKSSGNAALSNCYITSDCVFSANPITGAASYSGTAANLFTNPSHGIFSFKDNSFAGKSTAGDPRWR
ncbi:MAG: DUF5123 domain-containing protein, partial [Bacteroidota bacterium]|nr:DUF5123 domain-containing protein [Bacteroidota bacterium]